MQVVLQHVRCLDVNKEPGGRCQIEEKGQRTEIEEGLAGVRRTIFAGAVGSIRLTCQFFRDARWQTANGQISQD